MNNLHISQIVNDNPFQNNENQNNENQNNNNINNNNNLLNNNINSSALFLDELNNSFKENISKSVFDLVNCFICLSPANEPLTCPKCNNFACKKCLEKYFNGNREKKCPLCKRLINLNELKENKIVKDIEEILNKDCDKKNKIIELAKLIEEKKKYWENQTSDITNLIEKIFIMQDNLQKYKEEYDLFLSNIKILIENTFEDYNKKIQKLVDSLLTYNKVADESINKYALIYDKNKNNLYDNNNIKTLINEILALERNHFNDKTHKETNQFLNSCIKHVPSTNLYHINELKLSKNIFLKNNKSASIGNHFKLGDFSLKYTINSKKIYKALINFDFNLKNNNDKKMCFIISQFVIFKNIKEKLVPMKLIKNIGKTYNYECEVSFEEFYTFDTNEVILKTEALIFTT